MLRFSPFDVYKNVKTLINSSGDNVNYFCDLIKHLSKDKSKRFVLNSADSVFDGIKLPQNVVLTEENDSISIALSVIKISTSAYFPKTFKEDSKSSILPALLESSLRKINKNNGYSNDFNLIVKELRKTAQFMSDNTLQDNYGPLRPFVIDHLREYQTVLLNSKETNNLTWLESSLTLFDVMKIHSIDSKKLFNKIIQTVEKEPELIKKLPIKKLYHLSNMVSTGNIRKYLDDYIKTIPNKDLVTLIKHLRIVFNKYDKTTIETFLYSLMYKFDSDRYEKGDVLEVLRNLKILNDRVNDEDIFNLINKFLESGFQNIVQTLFGPIRSHNLNFTNTNNNTSSNRHNNSNANNNNNNNITYNNNKKQNLNRDHLAIVFETYMSLFKKKGCLQYHQLLSNFVLDNKEDFTPIHLISMIDSINKNHNSNSPNSNTGSKSDINTTSSRDTNKILVKNEYVTMSEVSDELTKHLLSQLEGLEFNDLCQVLYSLPLTKHFQFYDLLSSYPLTSDKIVVSRKEEHFKEKLMEIVKRRILYNLENNSTKNNLLYSKYMVNTMIQKDFDSENYFKRNLDDIVSKVSTKHLINTVTEGNVNNFDREVLNNMLNTLTSRLDTVNESEVIQRLIKKNRSFKNVKLNNKLLSILTYNSINDKNGFTNLIQSLPHFYLENDTSTLEIILNHLNRYMFHLSVYDVETLLSCLNKSNIFDNKILELLNHTYDANLSSVPNKVLNDLLSHLKEMRIRHEPVIRKFTDQLLSNFKDCNSYYIHDLIPLTDTLSELSIPYNDLYMYLTNYLSTNVNYLNVEKMNEYNKNKNKKKDKEEKENKSENQSSDNREANEMDNKLDSRLEKVEETNTSSNSISTNDNSSLNDYAREEKDLWNKSKNKDKNRGYKDEGYKNPNRFINLKMRDKIELLYSISNLGVVDNNLKTLYLSVIDQLYPDSSDTNTSSNNSDLSNTTDRTNKDQSDNELLNKSENQSSDNREVNEMEEYKLNNKEYNTLDKGEENDLLLKLYEIHLEFILNNIYNQEGDVISKKLERASKVWFTGQELKSQKFKKSDTYATIKNSLRSMNLKFESGVTEIYFCNFVIRDGDKSTVIYVVPKEDALRFWTTSLDPNNLIQNSDLSVGNSQKIIKNLKLSGYNVVELLQSKWDSEPFERDKYLRNQLNLN